MKNRFSGFTLIELLFAALLGSSLLGAFFLFLRAQTVMYKRAAESERFFSAVHKTRYYLDRLFCEYAILNIDSSEIIFRGGGKITCRNEILKFNSSILAEDLAVSFKTENKRLIISFIHPRSSLKADFSYEK